MEQQYSIEEIRQLENSLANDPSDTDLMNKLALGYLCCREAESCDKVDDLLEKAFEIRPSIKTANNYAYQLIVDWNDYVKGIEILQPFIDENPHSFMPYNLIGYAYLMNGNYEKAERYLEKANALSHSQVAETVHNLAVCKNFLNKPLEALTLYEKSIAIKDEENISKFNKAVCQIELEMTSDIDEIINQIKTSEAYKEQFASVSNTDLSKLSYLNNDLKTAYELLMEHCNVDLVSFPECSYLLIKYDDSKFNELVTEEIEMKKSWIAEFNDPEDEEYDDYTEEERTEEIKRLQDDIEAVINLRQKLSDPPEIKPSELYMTAFCGCMFYDCKLHGTPFDD